jgi:hypothetical protein
MLRRQFIFKQKMRSFVRRVPADRTGGDLDSGFRPFSWLSWPVGARAEMGSEGNRSGWNAGGTESKGVLSGGVRKEIVLSRVIQRGPVGKGGNRTFCGERCGRAPRNGPQLEKLSQGRPGFYREARELLLSAEFYSHQDFTTESGRRSFGIFLLFLATDARRTGALTVSSISPPGRVIACLAALAPPEPNALPARRRPATEQSASRCYWSRCRRRCSRRRKKARHCRPG